MPTLFATSPDGARIAFKAYTQGRYRQVYDHRLVDGLFIGLTAVMQ